MYDTANGLWWYCSNCQELADRGHKIKEKGEGLIKMQG